jgi:hypothetical protein
MSLPALAFIYPKMINIKPVDPESANQAANDLACIVSDTESERGSLPGARQKTVVVGGKARADGGLYFVDAACMRLTTAIERRLSSAPH